MTDSAVTVVSHDKYILMEMFKDEIGDKANDFIFTEGALVMLLMTIYLAAIKRVLKEYSRSINIDDSLISMIDLECEIAMEQEHLSISKKNYAFITVIKDFALKLDKMDSRGFKYKKSDANGALAEQVETDIHKKIMCKVGDIDFKDIIESIHKNTSDSIKMIKTDDFIINKKSVVKVSDVLDINWGDARMKAVRIWDRLFPETPIELPGSFGIIKVKFDDDIIDNFKMNHTAMYKKLVEHVTELFKFGFQNKVIKKVKQIMDPDDEDRDDIVRNIRMSNSDRAKMVLRDIIGTVNGNYDETEQNPDLFDILHRMIYDNKLSESDIKLIEKTFGITGGGKMGDPDDWIKDIDRIAVPIDINTVPLIFKENDYKLLDVEAGSEYEHLLSPLLNTTSISVVKNRSKNSVITNVLQVF